MNMKCFGQTTERVLTQDRRIETMLANAPTWALVSLIVLFAGCGGVAVFAYAVLVQPIMAFFFGNPTVFIEPSNWPIATILLGIAGAVLHLMSQSWWLTQRSFRAAQLRRDLVHGVI